MYLEEVEGRDLGYQYPLDSDGNELDLRVGSETSQEIDRRIKELCRMSRNVSDQFTPRCKQIDATLEAYMPEDEWDSIVRGNDSRRPVTVVVPMSFAMRELYLSFMGAIFGAGRKYRGLGSKVSSIKGALLERLCERQALWFKEAYHFSTVLSDAFSYGRGFAAVGWKKKMGARGVVGKLNDLQAMMLRANGINSAAGEVFRIAQQRVIAEGTQLQPIDIYNMFIDPRSPAGEIERASFVGWIESTTSLEVLKLENDPEEKLFNGKAAHYYARSGHGRIDDLWDRNGVMGTVGGTMYVDQPDSRLETNELHVITMCVNIIPRDWKMGSSQTPEAWMFKISGGGVVLFADRLDYYHGQFPIIECAPNANGHAAYPLSHLLVNYAYQKYANWTMKARMDAVNTILNGLIFYNPAFVDEDDMMNPGQGKLVRVKSSAYSEGGIDRYVHQMTMQDPTYGHVAEVGNIEQMAFQDMGLGAMAQGQLEQMADRTTKAGVNQAERVLNYRLKRIAMMVEEQAACPFAWQKAFNTQQFMGEEVYVPILGRYEQELRELYGMAEQIPVSPMDMDFAFDVYPVNYNLFDDTTGMTEALKTLMAVEGVGPQIAAEYRMGDLFNGVFRKLGFEDIDDYRARGGAPVGVTMLPDQMVQQQQGAGNFVPV